MVDGVLYSLLPFFLPLSSAGIVGEVSAFLPFLLAISLKWQEEETRCPSHTNPCPRYKKRES